MTTVRFKFRCFALIALIEGLNDIQSLYAAAAAMYLTLARCGVQQQQQRIAAMPQTFPASSSHAGGQMGKAQGDNGVSGK